MKMKNWSRRCKSEGVLPHCASANSDRSPKKAICPEQENAIFARWEVFSLLQVPTVLKNHVLCVTNQVSFVSVKNL